MDSLAAMKRRAIIAAIGIAVIFVLPVTVLAAFYPRPPQTEQITLGELRTTARVADTESERVKGLSGVESLAPDESMLFIYPEDGYHGIWMNDMNVALDIVWLNADKRMVHSEEYVLPSSYPRVYSSKVPARYVLELPAGTLDEYVIAPGSEARF